MGLPQELVNHTMNMLHGDLPALKACSLTCKAMFASTRHLIHKRLCLTVPTNQSVLTREEKSYHRERDRNDGELRFVSHMAERGLLRYTREVHILVPCRFTPEVLLPHLHHLRSLDRIRALTIEHFYAFVCQANEYKTPFTHFYSTLTSLTLRHSLGHFPLLLQFILQFPNLENLCIEWHEEQFGLYPAIPTFPHQSPPLCGHLRLLGSDTVVEWLTDYTHELPDGINFRSVELEDFFCHRAQNLLDTCAHTLESLTITIRGTGAHRFFGPLTDSGEWLTNLPRQDAASCSVLSSRTSWFCVV